MKASTCNKTKYIKKLLGVFFWIAVWQMIYVIVEREYIIPSPLRTLKLMAQLAVSGEFYADVLWTMGRVLLGMGLSFLLGALFASASYFLDSVRHLLSGPVVALKSTPVMSVILLAILALPTDGVPVFVCFLMCFPVVYTNLLAGMDSVDSALIELCRAYNICGKRRFLALYWPSVRPFSRAALILITGISWKTVVASEVFAVPRHSMGYHLLSAKAVLAADALFAWTISIVIFSFAFEKLMKRLIAKEWGREGRGFLFSEKRDDGQRKGEAGDVELRGVSKSFEKLELYRDFSITIAAGEITAIVGASGCGKTTLLRMISGLELPDGGVSILHKTGRVGWVFQEDRLFPWMTVRENLRMAAEADRVEEVLELMGLSEFGDYLPNQLSGGMRRRVSVGRALAYGAEVILLDEPFAGLDEELRKQMRATLRAIWKKQRCTVIFITHDKDEAEYLADHIVELFGRPVSARWLK